MAWRSFANMTALPSRRGVRVLVTGCYTGAHAKVPADLRLARHAASVLGAGVAVGRVSGSGRPPLTNETIRGRFGHLLRLKLITARRTVPFAGSKTQSSQGQKTMGGVAKRY